jgi:hypothetical protein
MAIPIDSTGGVAAVRALAPSSGNEALAKLLGAEIGTRMSGTVLSILKDGTSTVNINGATVRMQLPAEMKENSTLDLQLLSLKPGLTFLLGTKIAGVAVAQSQLPAQTASLQGTKVSEGVVISSAGKLVGELLSARAASNEPLAVISKTPIVNAPGASAGDLATGLKSALEFSGVFYESHVGQWASQERSLTQLQREPQMMAAPAATTPDTPTTLAGVASNSTAPAAVLVPEDAPIADPGRIALQLHTLEQQKIEWRGDVWPGQPMQWAVQRDASDAEAPSDDDSLAAWQSTMTFNLPSLGAVQAKLYLSNGHIRMVLSADNDEAAAALRAESPALGVALGDSGTALDAFVVAVKPLSEAR